MQNYFNSIFEKFNVNYIIIITLIFNLPVLSQRLSVVSPVDAGFDPQRLAKVDKVIQSSIEYNETPGAVLFVVRDTTIVYQEAYGDRQLLPERERMTLSTVFDLASITKPVATASAIFILVERGEIQLQDPVSRFIPGFNSWRDVDNNTEDEIRIIHLLTHTSGFSYPPVQQLVLEHGSPAPGALIDYVSNLKRTVKPGSSYSYSCTHYVILQQIIEIVSGKTLSEFCDDNIFKPLGMKNTTYNPTKEIREIIAPTTYEEEKLLRGIVHDPLARKLMGGISGNAGLFSNGKDLALFAAMLLNKGTLNGTSIFSPLTVSAFTEIPKGYELFGRSPGWDIHSDYSSNQGDLFSENTYGHTGYTGTSIVIDPETRVAVILLTNRVHPDDSSSVVRLRSLVANIVAGSIIE